MTHRPEQGVSISKALVDLANANRLRYICHDQYEQDIKDENGIPMKKRLTMTELGFVSTEAFNVKMDYDCLLEKYNKLVSDMEALHAERITLIKQNKEMSAKTHFKIATIIKGNKSDKEKIIEISKYINL